VNTIQEFWEDYADSVLPDDMDAEVRKCMKQAFYMGAGALLQLEMSLSEMCLSNEAEYGIVEGWMSEVHTAVGMEDYS